VYVAALDLGHVHDRSVFSIGHREGAAVVLDSMMVWAGNRREPVSFGEVEEAIVRAWERYRFTLTIDPWQALHLSERLRARGIRTREVAFTPAFKQRLASTLLQALNDGALHLYQAEGLREELLALRLKVSGGGSWTFDHVPGAHDDRVVSLSMMLVDAVERQGPVTTSCYVCGAQDIGGSHVCGDRPAIRRGDLVLVGDRHRDLTVGEMAAQTLANYAVLNRGGR
jgi:hypothetical protein